jgi:hypothetical protein
VSGKRPQELPARVEAKFAAACAWDERLAAFDRIAAACAGPHGLPRCEWEPWELARQTVVRERAMAWLAVGQAMAAPDEMKAGRLTLRESYAEMINQIGGEGLTSVRRVNGGE